MREALADARSLNCTSWRWMVPVQHAKLSLSMTSALSEPLHLLQQELAGQHRQPQRGKSKSIKSCSAQSSPERSALAFSFPFPIQRSESAAGGGSGHAQRAMTKTTVRARRAAPPGHLQSAAAPRSARRAAIATMTHTAAATTATQTLMMVASSRFVSAHLNPGILL